MLLAFCQTHTHTHTCSKHHYAGRNTGRFTWLELMWPRSHSEQTLALVDVTSPGSAGKGQAKQQAQRKQQIRRSAKNFANVAH